MAKVDGERITKFGASSPPETNGEIAKFWSDIQKNLEQDDLDALEDLLVAVCHSDNMSLLHSKSKKGRTITETICRLEANPCLLDCLDAAIQKGVAVTDECYRLVLGGNGSGYTSPDALVGLIKSGYFPLELDGRKTLERIVHVCDKEHLDKVFGPLLGDFSHSTGLKQEQIDNMKAKLPKIKANGKSYFVKGGKFAKWLKDCKNVRRYKNEELFTHEGNVENKENEASEGNMEKSAPPLARTKKIRCPVCGKAFESRDALKTHLANQSGAAHKRYRATHGSDVVPPTKQARTSTTSLCPVCRKSFNSHADLQEHLTTQSGVGHKRHRVENEMEKPSEPRRRLPKRSRIAPST